MTRHKRLVATYAAVSGYPKSRCWAYTNAELVDLIDRWVAAHATYDARFVASLQNMTSAQLMDSLIVAEEANHYSDRKAQIRAIRDEITDRMS